MVGVGGEAAGGPGVLSFDMICGRARKQSVGPEHTLAAAVVGDGDLGVEHFEEDNAEYRMRFRIARELRWSARRWRLGFCWKMFESGLIPGRLHSILSAA